MTVHGAAMGAGQTGGAGTDHGNPFAGGGGALERMFAEVCIVDGVALQQADQHRCAFVSVVTHAGLLAEDFGWTHPCATAAEDVRRENFRRGTGDVVLVNIADERGDIDLARARIHAGRVVAIQAARGFQMRLPIVERRRQIGEMPGEGGRAFVRVGRWFRVSITVYGLTVI